MRLYSNVSKINTAVDRRMLNHTPVCYGVRIEMVPQNTMHTSPDMLLPWVGNRLHRI
jgi:hypothetical protein